MTESPVSIVVSASLTPHNHNTKLAQTNNKITMSVDETMASLSIGRTMVYQLIRSNAIRTVKIGKKRLVIVASIHDYLNDLESYGFGQLGGE